MKTKQCTKCNSTKDISEFYTGRSDCKICKKNQRKQYYFKHKDRARKAAKSWTEKNKQYVSHYQKQYRLINKEDTRARKQHWKALTRYPLCDCCSRQQILDYIKSNIIPTYQLDHIIPASQGGQHCIYNIQWLSYEDHRKKSVKEYYDWLIISSTKHPN